MSRTVLELGPGNFTFAKAFLQDNTCANWTGLTTPPVYYLACAKESHAELAERCPNRIADALTDTRMSCQFNVDITCHDAVARIKARLL